MSSLLNDKMRLSPRAKGTVVLGLQRMVPIGASGYSQATNDVEED